MPTVAQHYNLGTILWRVPDHFNHLHVQGEFVFTGTPRCAGGTHGLAFDNKDLVALWADVDKRFPDTRYGGITVCKKIAGTDEWSQHAYRNALDIMIDHPVGHDDLALGDKIFAWLHGPYGSEDELSAKDVEEGVQNALGIEDAGGDNVGDLLVVLADYLAGERPTGDRRRKMYDKLVALFGA